MDIARSRYSGRQPLRPSLGAEYAVAVVWAEAALQAARAEAERAEVTQFLETARAEHNRRWVEPRRGNFPNEEFFVRRLETGDSGLQLRQEEDEAMAGVANAASYNQGYNL